MSEIQAMDPMAYRLLAIRRGLILKIDTGMELTRTATSLSVARRDGLTDKRTNRGALKDVNAFLETHGVPAAWSRTYPNG
ncbi:hypothetical protein SEA_BILLNYE_240 [Streptomyces phage BillNye]|uniref:Uncharacterized protein n=2 Tax=Wilnyevirus billnye TaxID=2560486 RepID=A0A2L1IW38_9CAUD|nr:hypothetical protein FDJ30_gp022 [Streptomyces phage BillNye]AVD99409.1 hypothetical protein SEA_BILLNYE_240 [Streptomyces phage BillNye]QBZ72492.1 hypothetical protein SEA_CIRCINUS_239 [Streptomyces phage Circinus]